MCAHSLQSSSRTNPTFPQSSCLFLWLTMDHSATKSKSIDVWAYCSFMIFYRKTSRFALYGDDFIFGSTLSTTQHFLDIMSAQLCAAESIVVYDDVASLGAVKDSRGAGQHLQHVNTHKLTRTCNASDSRQRVSVIGHGVAEGMELA